MVWLESWPMRKMLANNERCVNFVHTPPESNSAVATNTVFRKRHVSCTLHPADDLPYIVWHYLIVLLLVVRATTNSLPKLGPHYGLVAPCLFATMRLNVNETKSKETTKKSSTTKITATTMCLTKFLCQRKKRCHCNNTPVQLILLWGLHYDTERYGPPANTRQYITTPARHEYYNSAIPMPQSFSLWWLHSKKRVALQQLSQLQRTRTACTDTGKIRRTKSARKRKNGSIQKRSFTGGSTKRKNGPPYRWHKSLLRTRRC